MSKSTESASTSAKLPSMVTWIKEGSQYVAQNWAMLVKVYLFGLLAYLGTLIVIALPFIIAAIAAPILGLTWNFLTISLTVIYSVFAFIALFLVAGKMVLLQLQAIRSPIVQIRAAWKEITYSQAWAIYVVILISIFAFYTGLILLVIPGIIIGTWVSLAMFVYLEQKVGGTKSLILSRDYVRGYWWSVFGRILTTGIIYMIVLYITMNIYEAMLQQNAVLGVIGYILYMFASLMGSGLIYRLTYTLYLDLKKIKGEIQPNYEGWRLLRWKLLAAGPLTIGVLAVLVAIIASLA